MMSTGIICAAIAGFFGAVASSSAKLSLGASYIKSFCESDVRRSTIEERILTPEVGTTSCEWLHIPLRLLCGLLLFICNTVMWTFFAKALRHTSASAQATVTTTASNFLFSALFGYVIFGESHATLWWGGIILTLLGLFLLHGSSSKDQTVSVKKSE